ncbi:hypothetical protein ASC80_22450 [Afipia sp. Root123D2]|jgi:hypothetical protein|nr:hypothetical protein ASC80_22450 [Afipia sp. Root123D2]
MRPLGLVFKHLASGGINPDFLGPRARPDVERIAQPATTGLAPKLLVGDFPGMSLEGELAGLRGVTLA